MSGYIAELIARCSRAGILLTPTDHGVKWKALADIPQQLLRELETNKEQVRFALVESGRRVEHAD